jgi:hypothetical protein
MKIIKSLNLVLLTITIFSIVTISLLLENLNDENENNSIFVIPLTRYRRRLDTADAVHEIKCNFILFKSIKCLKSENGQVYVPFDFMSKKLDIHGNDSINKNDFKITFSSPHQIYKPILQTGYNSTKEYLWFSQLDVESRDRVKYLNLKYSIPVSSQWNSTGHIYPVQVGQFGLSHWSKWISNKTNSTKNSVHELNSKQFVLTKNSHLKESNFGFEFKFEQKTLYKMNYTSMDIRYFMADLDSNFNQNFDLIIDLMLNKNVNNNIVKLVYKFTTNLRNEPNNHIVKIKTDEATYEIHFTIDLSRKVKFIRNLCIDACKALKLNKCDDCLKSINNGASVFYKVYQISLLGQGKYKKFITYKLN